MAPTRIENRIVFTAVRYDQDSFDICDRTTERKGRFMNELKTTERAPRPAHHRQIKVGKWNDSLKTSDVNQIWTELHRIVSSHPLVRASKRAGFLVEEGKQNAYTDLTQELFVALLSKDRFQHYIDTAMADSEIEAEISQIELTNMLTAELRKRYPESYRLARRISTLIQTSAVFKRFDNIDNPEAHRRLADRLYGLSDWTIQKSRKDVQEMDERVKAVSFYGRDTRMVGCTGDAQIVISNPELEKLIIETRKRDDEMAGLLTFQYAKSEAERGTYSAEEYQEAEDLGSSVNGEGIWSLEALIAPDESYLLIGSFGRQPGYGNSDLYISYNQNGTWTTPKNLGPVVNTAARSRSSKRRTRPNDGSSPASGWSSSQSMPAVWCCRARSSSAERRSFPLPTAG